MFYKLLKSQLLGIKRPFKQQDLQNCYVGNFHLLEVVDRGSEIQLLVGGNFIVKFSALRTKPI